MKGSPSTVGRGQGSHRLHAWQLGAGATVTAGTNAQYFSAYTTANPAPPPLTIAVPSESRHFAEVVLGESLNSKLSSRTTVSEQVSFFPNLSSLGDYRITVDANAATNDTNFRALYGMRDIDFSFGRKTIYG